MGRMLSGITGIGNFILRGVAGIRSVKKGMGIPLLKFGISLHFTLASSNAAHSRLSFAVGDLASEMEGKGQSNQW